MLWSTFTLFLVFEFYNFLKLFYHYFFLVAPQGIRDHKAGIHPVSLALAVRTLNHWNAREVPWILQFENLILTFQFSFSKFFLFKILLRILSSNNIFFKNMLDLKLCYKKTPCFGEFWFNSASKFILELVHRVKRRADPNPLKNTCKLLVVADHRFYKYMGRGEESTTTNYLVSIWHWRI